MRHEDTNSEEQQMANERQDWKELNLRFKLLKNLSCVMIASLGPFRLLRFVSLRIASFRFASFGFVSFEIG